MKLEIAERKNTTASGLKALENLIKNLNDEALFSSDVNTIKSEVFYGKIEVNNGMCYNDIHYMEWINTDCIFQIKEGVLSLRSVDDGDERERKIENIMNFIQIDFKKCIEQLQSVIQKHSDLCDEKDKQVEEFLTFCDAWENSEKIDIGSCYS